MWHTYRVIGIVIWLRNTSWLEEEVVNYYYYYIFKITKFPFEDFLFSLSPESKLRNGSKANEGKWSKSAMKNVKKKNAIWLYTI